MRNEEKRLRLSYSFRRMADNRLGGFVVTEPPIDDQPDEYGDEPVDEGTRTKFKVRRRECT
jgi:hypothetical protein